MSSFIPGNFIALLRQLKQQTKLPQGLLAEAVKAMLTVSIHSHQERMPP